MSPSDPIKPFVEQYVKLVSDADSIEFQKVLDMKGIKRVEQNQYLELFKTVSPNTQTSSSAATGGVSSNNPSTTITSTVAGMGQGTDESRIKKLERLIKQRL